MREGREAKLEKREKEGRRDRETRMCSNFQIPLRICEPHPVKHVDC